MIYIATFFSHFGAMQYKKICDKTIHRGIPALQRNDPFHERHDLLFCQRHILNMLKTSSD